MALNNLSNRLSARPARGGAGRHRGSGDIRRASPPPGPTHFARPAPAHSTLLSSRLSDLGRREDALAAVEEAVDIYRAFAAVRPDAFRPSLAGAAQQPVEPSLRSRQAPRCTFCDRGSTQIVHPSPPPSSMRLDLNWPHGSTPLRIAFPGSGAKKRRSLRTIRRLAYFVHSPTTGPPPSAPTLPARSPTFLICFRTWGNVRLPSLPLTRPSNYIAALLSPGWKLRSNARPIAKQPFEPVVQDLGQREEGLAAAVEATNLSRPSPPRVPTPSGPTLPARSTPCRAACPILARARRRSLRSERPSTFIAPSPPPGPKRFALTLRWH